MDNEAVSMSQSQLIQKSCKYNTYSFHLQVYKSDIADLRKELDHSRKSYDKEKMKNADLETQLTTLDQDMKFKIQLLETELQEEKSRNKIDFNAIDRQLKSDYENR